MTSLGREVKERLVDDLAQRLGAVEHVVMTTFGRMSVADAELLRRKLREVNAGYLITKISLCRRALERAGRAGLSQFADGPTGVVLVREDAIQASKVLAEFIKSRGEVLTLRGGWVEGEIVSADTVRALAALPSREELIACVVRGVNAPLSGLAGALAGVLRQLVTAVHEIAKRRGT